LEGLIIGVGRGTEKMGWTDGVKNEISRGVKEKSNILHTLKRRKAYWIGHMVLRNWLLQHFIE
jgi:hypothetical protein